MRRLALILALTLHTASAFSAEPSKFTLPQSGSGIATELAANGANCEAGQSPLGVDTFCAVESCWTPVSGPASATDNAICRFDATTGKLVQNSVLTIDDTTGNLTGPSGGFSIIGGTGATDDLILDGSAGTAGSASVTEDGRFISGVAGTATNPSFKLPGGAAGLFDDYGTGGAAISYATGTGFALYAGTIPKLIVDNAAPAGLKLPLASLVGWGTIGGTMTTQLYGDVSDTLSLRRTTNPQSMKVYGTYTDASNYERVALSCDGSADCTLKPETAGTGADDMKLHLQGTGVAPVQIDSLFNLTPMASPPATPVEGDIYSDTSHALCWYDGSGWQKLAGAGTCA